MKNGISNQRNAFAIECGARLSAPTMVQPFESKCFRANSSVVLLQPGQAQCDRSLPCRIDGTRPDVPLYETQAGRNAHWEGGDALICVRLGFQPSTSSSSRICAEIDQNRSTCLLRVSQRGINVFTPLNSHSSILYRRTQGNTGPFYRLNAALFRPRLGLPRKVDMGAPQAHHPEGSLRPIPN
jgi:hypothetical protein